MNFSGGSTSSSNGSHNLFQRSVEQTGSYSVEISRIFGEEGHVELSSLLKTSSGVQGSCLQQVEGRPAVALIF